MLNISTWYAGYSGLVISDMGYVSRDRNRLKVMRVRCVTDRYVRGPLRVVVVLSLVGIFLSSSVGPVRQSTCWCLTQRATLSPSNGNSSAPLRMNLGCFFHESGKLSTQRFDGVLGLAHGVQSGKSNGVLDAFDATYVSARARRYKAVTETEIILFTVH